MTPTTPTPTKDELVDACRVAASDAVLAKAEADAAYEVLYATWNDVHGRPDQGKLTYQEIADASGCTKGWVRLALGNYRKRLANRE